MNESSSLVSDFGPLLAWFAREGRIYPWSLTRDPYEIWISEVMLQQTVVGTVITRYERWLHRWPDMKSLAQAEESQVMREWEGLGYYNRGLGVLRAAKELVAQGFSTLPNDEAKLRLLPGIGPYTAAAVVSFAFGDASLTLDANLKRVFQRLGNQAAWTSDFEKIVRGTAQEAFRLHPSRDVNLGLMQLGQLVCRPRVPDCAWCPLKTSCGAYQSGRTGEIPQRTPRRIEEKATSIQVFFRASKADALEFFVARPTSGRFASLWAFPPGNASSGRPLTRRVHTYTRFKDRLTPYLVSWKQGDPPIPEGWNGRWFSVEELLGEGMPSVHRKILQEAIRATSF